MTGDIVLQRCSGIAGWIVKLFTRSVWVHVGMDLGDGTIVHVEWGGKKITSYSDWLDVMSSG
jgi:hypothetical protein